MSRTSRLVPAAALSALALASAAPAVAAPIPLPEISRYLNGLTTAEAPFTQINSDGTISTGELYIARPGRVRFQYAAPDSTLVIANDGTVAVLDSKSNQPPQQYPLKRTPLNLILARNIDLSRARMVKSLSEEGVKTIVTAQDPDHPDYGSIQMVFTAQPTQLRQWVITDEGGTQTTVVLGDMKTGVTLPPSLFDIRAASPNIGKH